MAERIQHPEWRREQETTRYPFAERATLTNDTDVILEGLFLDAQLYPVGGGARMYLSRVDIAHDTVTLVVGAPGVAELASGEFDLIEPPDTVALYDGYGRPAGLFVSEAIRLASFQSWNIGEHVFAITQTEFAATVCVPQPAVGLRGIALEDGTLFTGDVWIVGDDGVVVRYEENTADGRNCDEGPLRTFPTIRIDVVGDPLFKRRLCTPPELFETPRFLRTITFQDNAQAIVCGPNARGDIKMTVNNDLAEDTVLRVRATPDGIVIEAVGESLESVRNL